MHPPGVHSAVCLNCSAPLSGPFCAQCGQRDIPPYPSVRELVIDAFWELSGWDGRFASTVRALVRKPGKLTREFLEGRRASYLSPLRLYLMASLVYFVIAASAPNVRLASGKTAAGLSVSVTDGKTKGPTAPERVANAVKGSLAGENPDPDPSSGSARKEELTPEQKAAALKDIERAPALMRPFLRRAVTDPGGFKRGLVESMPRMLFALLPIFAAIVAIFYRRRKYPEHLYFAIHLHAFIFLALAVVGVLKFTRSVPLVTTGGVIALVWIPIYATLAFRRVYGGGVAATIAKEIGIGAIYLAAAAAAFIVTIYWVSLYG
jgi:hypothetical protein